MNRPKFLYRARSHREDFLGAVVVGAVHAILVTLVDHFAPGPYMDEIFHIRQTRNYCKGDYRWDPMITTPPALYVLAMPFCGHERYVNSILTAFAFAGFCRFRRMFSRDHVLLSALVALLLPVLLHSSALFYTDTLSVCAVVWALSTRSPLAASGFFLIAVLTRQTNIVWAGLYAAVRLCHRVDYSRPIYSLLSGVASLWSLVLLAASFVVFLFVNGGVVLGDATAHEPKPHIAQFFYLLLFCALHAWPLMLLALRKVDFGYIRVQPMSIKNFALATVIMSKVINTFTYDHPYLLADNRHVPFYLWRRWLAFPDRRQLLAPFYIAALHLMNRLSTHHPPLVRVLFVLATMAVVIPAHLIEPRYFIIPYVIWRLSAKTESLVAVIFELLSQLAVFSIVMYLFLFKPFEWENEPGVKQRFMW